jgi:hypothetical protein
MEIISLWLITIVIIAAWSLVIWSVKRAWTLLADMRRSVTMEREFEHYADGKKSQLYK